MRISRQLLFRLVSLLLGVHIFITGGRSAAQDLSSITWGIELTATTDRNDASDVGAPVDGKIVDFPRKVAEAFAKEVGSVVIEDNRSLKDRAHQVLSVKTANGIWKFHNDHGSVEAVSPILSTAQISSAEAVFSAFKKAGLKPLVAYGGLYGGGGHIHVGRNIFDENPLLLRNFIVDLLNRPYLRTALEEPGDPAARGVREMGAEKEFRRRLSILDGKFNRGEAVTARDVAVAHFESFDSAWKVALFRLLPSFIKTLVVRNMKGRNVDINLANIMLDLLPTAEFRTPRPPSDIEVLKKRIKFLEAYLHYLKSFKKPIEMIHLSKSALAQLGRPSIVFKQWERFVSKIKLEPSEFAYEIEERFPALAKGGQTTLRGNQLEIREGVSQSGQRNFEIRVVSFQPVNDLQIELTSNLRINSKFVQSEPGIWIAHFQVPEAEWFETIKVAVFFPEHKIFELVSGDYKLWNGRFGLFSEKEKFSKFLKSTLRKVFGYKTEPDQTFAFPLMRPKVMCKEIF